MNARLSFSAGSLLALSFCLTQGSAQRPATEITLERIMADQEWVARSPSGAYWADDSRSFYWSQKRLGSNQQDLVQMNLEGRELRRVDDAGRPFVDVSGGDLNEDRSVKVYSRNGDLFMKHLTGNRAGEIVQLTRTPAGESAPFFLAGDERIAFRRGGTWLVRDLSTGLEYQVADVRGGKDPDADEEKDDASYLEEQNLRLSEYLALQKRQREEGETAADARSEADPTASPMPFYLGAGVTPRTMVLSPDSKWMAVTYGGTSGRAKSDNMAVWVTESSYVEPRTVRSLVGTSTPATTKLALLDLAGHSLIEVDLEALPGITEHPVDAIRAASKSKNDGGDEDPSDAEEKKDEDPKPRTINVSSITWNEGSTMLVFQVRSTDNKERWIGTVAVADAQRHTGNGNGDDALKATVVERRTDEAWIGRISSGMGWLDEDNLWYLSETTGYSQLYFHDTAGSTTTRVTTGDYEVASVAEDDSGPYLYFRANMEHPGVTETHRIHVETREIEQITDLGGMNSAALSPDGEYLLITHSEMLRPAELYVQSAQPGASARRVTDTLTDEFKSLPWITPTVVEIANEDGDPVYSRLYLPPNPAPGKRPAVLFIHGAGYLQNAHKGWSNYSREFMFHSLLAHRGYVVLDMDYRASAGYGRDWRTAIYRQMGTPELADLVSGVEWLVANHEVDAAKIGCYGGSYGGFMTLMALFNAPEVFLAGAALRPVTDWAHYNHGYTSNILNTPEDDPEAYEISSPIEYAEGLQGHLLIAHGMLDNNVFFQDSVRLVQRLIELEKENWETAIYPVEAHGFRQPSSWLDEYRRILKLFETHLR